MLDRNTKKGETYRMALTFYYGSGSPFAWRVWLALEHKGIAHTLRTMSFSAGDLKTPEYLAINPRGQVPAIEHDGFALAESAAIVEYLEDAFPGTPALFPGDARRRAAIRSRIQQADQAVLPIEGRLTQRVLFTKREAWNPEKIDDALAQLKAELVLWEPLVGGAWLVGDAPTAADFTLYPLLALALRSQVKRPETDVRGCFGPRLDAWMTRCTAHPLFDSTVPPHWKS